MTHLCHFDALNIHRCDEYALDCSFGLYSIAQWNFTRLDHAWTTVFNLFVGVSLYVIIAIDVGNILP
jgi:hypothetical protein